MTDTDVVPRQTSPADGDPALVDEELANSCSPCAGPGRGAPRPRRAAVAGDQRRAERALGEELTQHLGHEKHDPAGRGSGNFRNFRPSRRLLTEVGGIDLDVPRDRADSFEPKIDAQGPDPLVKHL